MKSDKITSLDNIRDCNKDNDKIKTKVDKFNKRLHLNPQ